MNSNSSLVDSFLDYLGLSKQPPNLDFLNELVRQHQLKVPFETMTKVLDYDRLYRSSSFMPEIGDYISRLRQSGTGGTCWTLARGFYWLLRELGFVAHYIYMDPGHVCLVVQLDQSYYVDVGYSAPLFCAYPLNESFVVDNAREKFSYSVNGDSIVVLREPGPRKVLDITPRTFDDLAEHFIASNQWTVNSFMIRLSVFGYINNVPTLLMNNQLRQFFDSSVEENQLSEQEILDWLDRKFKLDPAIYQQAKFIRDKWLRHYGLEIP